MSGVRRIAGGMKRASSEQSEAQILMRALRAAAGMCDWIVNIVIYHDIYLDVEPKRQKLNEAVEQLNAANKKLQAVRAHVQGLEDRKAERTQLRANLAQRLVNGLKDEGIRWTVNVGQ